MFAKSTKSKYSYYQFFVVYDSKKLYLICDASYNQMLAQIN